jgi:outer membrane protein assembly factor BamB
MSVEGTDVIVTPTDKNMVALALSDGKLLWQVPFSQGRYNAATPLVDGQAVIYAAGGTTAERVTLSGDAIETQQLWNNADAAVMFNSPVIKDNLIFGLTGMNVLFCVRKDTGETAWTAPLSAEPAAPPTAEGGRGRRGRGGGGRGYGSLVEAGAVLFGLTPAGELFVFEPSDQEFRRLASYKVAAGGTYAYPVIAGQRVLIKDEQAVTLWMIE